MIRLITLPNGRRVTLGTYVTAWRSILANPDADYPGFDHFPECGWHILVAIRDGLHDRINRHLPHYYKGRKWDPDWQRVTSYHARQLNTPRLRIYWLPPHLKQRFANRLARHDD
jgi:hypothetical protein